MVHLCVLVRMPGNNVSMRKKQLGRLREEDLGEIPNSLSLSLSLTYTHTHTHAHTHLKTNKVLTHSRAALIYHFEAIKCEEKKS